MTQGAAAWLGQLRRIHDNLFGAVPDWTQHLARLNRELKLVDEDDRFTSAVERVASPLFNGDVCRITPGAWTLVLSLNPQHPRHNYDRADGHTRSTWWDLWRRKNTDYPNPFFDRLARVAATGHGVELSSDADVLAYSTDSMVFVELCPYASRRFVLSDEQIQKLGGDVAYEASEEFRRVLIEHAEPALILIHGHDARKAFERAVGRRIKWTKRRYKSDAPQKLPKPQPVSAGTIDALPEVKAQRTPMLRHRECIYAIRGHAIPVVAFGFFGKRLGFIGPVGLP